MDFKELVNLANELGIRTGIASLSDGECIWYKAFVNNNMIEIELAQIDKRTIATFDIVFMESGMAMMESMGFHFNDIEFWRDSRAMVQPHRKYYIDNPDISSDTIIKVNNIINLIDDHIKTLLK